MSRIPTLAHLYSQEFTIPQVAVISVALGDVVELLDCGTHTRGLADFVILGEELCRELTWDKRVKSYLLFVFEWAAAARRSHLFCHVCVILSDFLVANFKVAFVLTNEFHGLGGATSPGVEGASFEIGLM